MKKLIFLLLFLVLKSGAYYAQAQDCKCKEGPLITKTFVICGYRGADEDGFPVDNPNAVVIDIVYREIECNGVITIEPYSFTTHSPMWNYRDYGYLPNTITPPCPDMFPTDANGWPLDLIGNEPLWEAWIQS